MFYRISGGFFRKKSKTDAPFIIERVFKDQDILKAREECFKAFHSYIEVFLLGIEKEYLNYEQAVLDLQDYFVSYRERKLKIINDDEFIQISFAYDETPEFISKDKKVTILKGEIVIHGMGILKREREDAAIFLKNLLLEKSIYLKHNINYKASEYFENEPNINNEKFDIINTPIDFTFYTNNDL
jgi:hypothetical protein